MRGRVIGFVRARGGLPVSLCRLVRGLSQMKNSQIL